MFLCIFLFFFHIFGLHFRGLSPFILVYPAVCAVTWQCFFSHFSLPIIPLESCCHCLNIHLCQTGDTWSIQAYFISTAVVSRFKREIFVPTLFLQMFLPRFFIQRNKWEVTSFWIISVQSKAIKQFLIFCLYAWWNAFQYVLKWAQVLFQQYTIQPSGSSDSMLNVD